MTSEDKFSPLCTNNKTRMSGYTFRRQRAANLMTAIYYVVVFRTWKNFVPSLFGVAAEFRRLYRSSLI